MPPKSYLCTAVVLCGITLTARAQAPKPDEHLFKPTGVITVDGNLRDWGDSLRYYNEEKKLYYTIANDGQFLYLAMRFNDRSEQERILWAGLTWGINPKGKKKETYSLTFRPQMQVVQLPQSYAHLKKQAGIYKNQPG